MAFHRRARFAVAFIAINCLLLASPGMAQQHDDKQELRARLFKQVLADFPDIRECLHHRRRRPQQPLLHDRDN